MILGSPAFIPDSEVTVSSLAVVIPKEMKAFNLIYVSSDLIAGASAAGTTNDFLGP